MVLGSLSHLFHLEGLVVLVVLVVRLVLLLLLDQLGLEVLAGPRAQSDLGLLSVLYPY